MYQTSIEQLTHEPCKEWVTILPKIVKEYNKIVHENYKKPKESGIPKGSSTILLKGTKVRIQLDNPIDSAKLERLHGRFRSSDIRWDPEVKEITEIYLTPDKPPLYEVDNNNKVAYTKAQLQVVDNDEQDPPAKKLLPRQKKFVIKKVLERRPKGSSYEYKVSYKGYDSSYDLWQDRNFLLTQIPDFLKKFDDKHPI